MSERTHVESFAIIELIAEAINDSLEPEWTPQSAAYHVMQWLDDAGLRVVKAQPNEPAPGSNEWLAQSPLFHPGDLA